MKGKQVWMVIGAVIIVIIVALIFVTLNRGGNDMPSKFKRPGQSSASSAEVVTTEGTGKYVDYSQEALANAEGRRWIFFHAGWCPQCKALEDDINATGVPDGITIFKADYDTSGELKKKYGVTQQTTIVEVDEQGNKINSFVAYDDPSVAAVVSGLGD